MLENAFEQEFLHTFGGCTVIRNIKGMYFDSDSRTEVEPVSLVYSDTPFDCDRHFEIISDVYGRAPRNCSRGLRRRVDTRRCP